MRLFLYELKKSSVKKNLLYILHYYVSIFFFFGFTHSQTAKHRRHLPTANLRQNLRMYLPPTVPNIYKTNLTGFPAF